MVKKIAIILPIAYRGGSLRVAKTIARMLQDGSKQDGEMCRVNISVLEDKYDIKRDFRDVLADDITVSEFRWRHVEYDAVALTNKLSGFREPEMKYEKYQQIDDGVRNLMDFDFWILISDRTEYPIAPVKPYAVFATDYIQRYVPEIFPRDKWGEIDTPFILTVRGADAVITTTPQTFLDAVSYAGIPKSKVRLAPMDFDPTPFAAPDTLSEDFGTYIIWPTNTTQHKNHLNALDAAIDYWSKGGSLRLKIVGPNSVWMDPSAELPLEVEDDSYLAEIRKKVSRSHIIKKNVDFLGEVTDTEYAALVAGAKFLWHPTIYDNGTFAVAEAAWLGTPTLSSGYPQMRYIGDRFNIPMLYFDARDVDSMAGALAEMDANAASYRAQLPSRESLSDHSWKKYSSEYWDMVKGIFECA